MDQIIELVIHKGAIRNGKYRIEFGYSNHDKGHNLQMIHVTFLKSFYRNQLFCKHHKFS